MSSAVADIRAAEREGYSEWKIVVNFAVELGCATPKLLRCRIIFPMLLKLAVAMPCAQVKDRLSTWNRPAHPRLLQPLLNDVLPCGFDYSGSDWQIAL